MTVIFSEANLGSIARIEIGRTPSRAVSRYWNGTQPWLTISDYDQGDTIDATGEAVSQAAVEECGIRVHRAGTLVMSFKLTIGKLGFLNKPMATNEAIAALIPIDSDTLDTRYLFHYLRHFNFDHLVDRAAKGRTLNKEKLSNVEVRFPREIREQQRIAAILDKVDEIRLKRERALVMADHFVLSTFIQDFGHPLDPSVNVDRTDLSHHCDFFAGNSLPVGEEFNGQDGGLFLIKVSDLNLPGNETAIRTANLWAASRAKVKGGVVAPKGAIVFPKRGGAIATNKKRVLERDAALDPNLMAVAPKSGSVISNYYIRTWFELIDLASISSGSSVPQLNKKDLAPLSFRVPSSNEVKRFDRVYGHIDSLKDKLRKSLNEAAEMCASVSQRAFTGEL